MNCRNCEYLKYGPWVDIDTGKKTNEYFCGKDPRRARKLEAVIYNCKWHKEIGLSDNLKKFYG